MLDVNGYMIHRGDIGDMDSWIFFEFKFARGHV